MKQHFSKERNVSMQRQLHGFTLKETKVLEDIQLTAYLYEHDQTKAQVMYFDTTDDNKAFTIAFATPPYDDNGICHIIEHSVLNGSKKYPTKEPFVDLLKSSLQTFLNAMTYGDKTVYPVASRNQKDFENLMSVYLDAVFAPNFYTDKQVLMQEGWHYHLEQPEDELIYKGVVYNEMRGAFSSPEAQMSSFIEAALLPDTIYAHESGGKPESIPTLTQEKFIDYHQKYYHPSNAKVFLYGDLDIEAAFKQLAEYFDQYDYQEFAPLQVEQKPFEQVREVTEYYSVDKDESTDNKTLLGYVWTVGNSLNREEGLAFSILDEVLLGNNSSPLKKALLQAGIAADVFGGYGIHAYNTMFDIVLKDSNPEAKDQFVQIVRDELTRLVTEGLPKKLVQAALNKKAFSFKEAVALEGGTPKGIVYALNSLKTWLYGGSPYTMLEFNEMLAAITQKASQGYFEQLVQEKLLNNTHALVVTFAPKAGLGEEKERELAATLKAYKESLSQEEIKHLVEETQALLVRQETPDAPEKVAKIPVLSKEDIDPQAEQLDVAVEEVEGTTFLHFDAFTSAISYVGYQFDLSGVPTEKIPVAAFLAELLGEVATEQYTEEELVTEIDFYTGGITTDTTVLVEDVVHNRYYPQFSLRGRALAEYVPELVRLMTEIVTNSQLQDKAKINEVLLKSKVNLELSMTHASHITAARRLKSYYSEADKYVQLLEGLDYYDYIVDLLEHFDEKVDSFISDLEEVKQLIFTTNHVIVDFCGSKEDYEAFKAVNHTFFDALPHTVVEKQPFTAPVEVLNEGLKTSQEVQYVAQGYNQTLLGEAFNGQVFVVKSLLGLDYFWNNIRVKGGAYGGISMVSDKGDLFGVSYRDPNLTETLAVYAGTADYLENYFPTPEEFEKTIIGTFSTIDQPMSVVQKGGIACLRYLTRVTHEDVQRMRDEVLQATPEKIRAYGKVVRQMMDKQAYVVVGNATKIEEHKELFGTVRQLIK